jgi:UDP-N-acetylmuramoyl-L-alanyl-D-glutamate--2,6-diaminopimelate ligase
VNLREVLKGISYDVIYGNLDIEINKIEYDSRKVKNNDIFFCISGFKVDGHDFVNNAILNGASVIICEKDLKKLSNTSVTIIKVLDSRKALAIAASNFYGDSWKKLKLIGVTGTNGKTTSTYMIKSILEQAGFKVGLIGTIANYIGNKKIQSNRTTPESLELHKLFKEMADEGVTHCVMEVSSHSLELNRVYGLEFAEGMFTNLTRDHLDFHKTFENYYNAKLLLFKNSKTSIINMDDEYGKKIYNDINTSKVTYGIESFTDIKAQNIHINSKGIEFDMCYKDKNIPIELNIPGKYNVYNALGSASVCLNEGISIEKIKEGLKNVFVPGRCEIVTKGYNLEFDIIIDYAHTPDGLENILKTAREFTKGRIITVFGCGGDRDKTKRPLMGKIAGNLSDITIVTSDNPRSENPNAIIEDILKGMESENYVVIENRREAIENAIKIAKKDDVVIIAGKGHENYQELKDTTIHFDEKEIIADIIKELF